MRDYRKKPFAELYLDVLCDDMDAAIEFKRRFFYFQRFQMCL